MGTRRSLSVSLKDCGICGSELADYRRHVGGGAPGDNGGGAGGGAVAAATEAASVQLACKHLFHPSCIKGWTLVGATLRAHCAPEALLFTLCGGDVQGSDLSDRKVCRLSAQRALHLLRECIRELGMGLCQHTVWRTVPMRRPALRAGKKDVCPVCMEKVDLRALYADRAWNTSNLTW